MLNSEEEAKTLFENLVESRHSVDVLNELGILLITAYPTKKYEKLFFPLCETGIDPRAYPSLKKCGCKTLYDIIILSKIEIKVMKNIGDATIKKIEALIEEYGFEPYRRFSPFEIVMIKALAKTLEQQECIKRWFPQESEM